MLLVLASRRQRLNLHKECCPIRIASRRNELVPDVLRAYVRTEIYDWYENNNEAQTMADQDATFDPWKQTG